jgi:hypothetical protein
MSDQFKDMRPLTKGMIEFLIKCNEMELMNLQPSVGLYYTD